MSSSLGQISLSHVAISCSNLEESIHFYTHILGLEVNESLGRNNGNIKLDVGAGTYLELFPFDMYQSANQGALAHFALNVSCLDSAMVYLKEKGVHILRGPFEVTDPARTTRARRILFIPGPDGEEIELVQTLI